MNHGEEAGITMVNSSKEREDWAKNVVSLKNDSKNAVKSTPAAHQVTPHDVVGAWVSSL